MEALRNVALVMMLTGGSFFIGYSAAQSKLLHQPFFACLTSLHDQTCD